MNKKAGYAFRIVLGGYLAYLGVGLIFQMIKEKPSNMVLLCIVGGIFLIIGGGYAVYNIKKVWDIVKEEKGWGISKEQGAEEANNSADSNKVREMNMHATQIKHTVSGQDTVMRDTAMHDTSIKDTEIKTAEKHTVGADEQDGEEQQTNAEVEKTESVETEEATDKKEKEQEQEKHKEAEKKEVEKKEIEKKEQEDKEIPEEKEKKTSVDKSEVSGEDARVIRLEAEDKNGNEQNDQNDQEPAEEIENDYEER